MDVCEYDRYVRDLRRESLRHTPLKSDRDDGTMTS